MTTTSDGVAHRTTAIDKEALKRKYAEERAKRIRPDGNAQYLELKGQLAHYAEDPYTPQDLTATVFHCLGYRPGTEIRGPLGRPGPVSRGEVLRQVF